jgi:hypothetical protein
MQKNIKIIIATISVALLATLFVATFSSNRKIRAELKVQSEAMKSQSEALKQLTDAVTLVAGRNNIQFQITPNVTNKINTTFGSAKEITMQYYFTLDGSAIMCLPDSAYTIQKSKL